MLRRSGRKMNVIEGFLNSVGRYLSACSERALAKGEISLFLTSPSSEHPRNKWCWCENNYVIVDKRDSPTNLPGRNNKGQRGTDK